MYKLLTLTVNIFNLSDYLFPTIEIKKNIIYFRSNFLRIDDVFFWFEFIATTYQCRLI